MQIQGNHFTQNPLTGTPAVKIVTQGEKPPAHTQNNGSLSIQAHDAASVTISREGRSYQQRASSMAVDGLIADSQKAFQAAQEAVAKAGKHTKETDPNREALDGVKDRFDSIMEDRTAVNTRDSIQEMQRALADIRRMKEFKEEARQRVEKETRSSAAVSARQQAETEKAKGDLLVMLESFKEQDEEDDGENTSAPGEENGENAKQEDGANKAADIVQHSATQMKTSMMDKKDISSRSIETIENKGTAKLHSAEEEYRNFMQEYDVISRALEEDLTDEQKTALVSQYVDKAQGDRYHPGGFAEISRNRQVGLAERQNARDLRREARGVEGMPEMNKLERTQSAALSEEALNGQAQQFMEQSGSELDRRLEKELQDRNDAAENREEAKEAEGEKMEKEQKKAENTAKTESSANEAKSASGGPVNEDWYTDALEELDEFIESQGIYIRQ